ncbi:hypothetical protein TNCV_3030801 [Trichonephila clavipes]|nr:hypothetical protein TNCV_3030801 [Trichonephila clavipes]
MMPLDQLEPIVQLSNLFLHSYNFAFYSLHLADEFLGITIAPSTFIHPSEYAAGDLYLFDLTVKLHVSQVRKYDFLADFGQQDWWCRAGRGNAVKTRRVELAVFSWPLPKNYSNRSYESSLDGAASECSNK